ncbi:Protein phosphatase 1 regulatory subunit 3D [Tulasnella sp. 425]|nr:Protein phosphatase 1 regulatory subunit 3D [Tulasnella sp. 425]
MTYTPPGTLTAADRNLTSEGNHHRSGSFTDEEGPGAFAPLAGVQRRNARPGIPKFTMPGGPLSASFSVSTAASSASVSTPPRAVAKSPKFELRTDSSEDSEEENKAANAATAAIHNPLASKIMSHGTSSPTAQDLLSMRPPPAVVKSPRFELHRSDTDSEDSAAGGHTGLLKPRDLTERNADVEEVSKAPGMPTSGPSNSQSRLESPILKYINDNLVQELACIENTSTPSTKQIVDLILALGRAVPNAIRSKHQLYRLGIEVPVESMYLEGEGTPIQAQYIHRLNYLVNEMKQDMNMAEDTRELLLKILSDTATVTMKSGGLGSASLDFWDAAAGALKVISLENRLDRDTLSALHDSWGNIANLQILAPSSSISPAPATPQNPIPISLPEEIIRLYHEVTPAAEPLVLLLQSLGRGAPMVTRNKHKIYAILARARDICNHILAIGASIEFSGLENLEEYYNLIEALEGVLLNVAKLLPTEQISFGPEMCVSWSEGRETLCEMLNELHKPPFCLGLSNPEQELANNVVFDDYYWLSLLHEGIEQELDGQYSDTAMPPAVASVREGLWYLENEIKCRYQDDATRELVINIATRLYEALSISASQNESDPASTIRSGEPRSPIVANQDSLLEVFANAFSVLDFDSSLQPSDIQKLNQRWLVTSASVKSPKFELHAGSSEDSTVHGHSAPLSRPVPFPSLSVTAASPMQQSVSSPPIAGPSAEQQPSPSVYLSPYSSLRSEPSARDKFPVKPALKSNHSSPHLPSLAHQRALTQSAPSTPNLQGTAVAALSDGGSASRSPGPTYLSTYFVTQPPRSVHFASEKSVLESVVVFSKGARPQSLSNPDGYDSESETEGYDAPVGSGSRYPFPAMPKNEIVPKLDEAVSSEVPMKRALSSNGYGVSDERHFVYLETIVLPATRPPTLRGSVLVRDVAFQKRVAVKFTLDDWQTISEVSCTYSVSLPNIPPPFSSSGSLFTPSHSRSAIVSGIPSSGLSSNLPISNRKSEPWSRFTFAIKLEEIEWTLPNKRMFLVVRYQVPSQWGWESGGEWWDNNADKSYELAFKMGKKATANSSSTEEGGQSALARGLASVNRGHDTSPVTRTQSLPSLPPPGPVRASPSPLYTPPLPGSVPGLTHKKATANSSATEEGGPSALAARTSASRDQPDTTPIPQFGLGLNMGASPASGNGPPPEFLAKYCFFVSSPGVSPPTTTSPANSSAVASPSVGSVVGTGVDTPRANSPGLANTAAWWGYSSNAVSE